MTSRRHRLAPLMGALLALLAVLGMIALSAWHGSNVHDDDASHVASVQHVHDAVLDDDADSPIHVAAHSAGHGLAVPSSAAPLPRLTLHGQGWPELSAVVLSGLDPGSILRPPRA
jgi:hypothetical protein